jgi:hypothetical protein
MAFSKQAIGFYLEVDDRLTPALKKAEKGYKKFVTSLEKHNTKAFKSASSGMGQLANLVRSLETLPKKAAASYDTALGKIRKKASKAIRQPVNLVFTTRSMKDLSRSIGKAVAEAMGKASIRLRASMPQTKLKMFDTGVSLRSAYQNIAQPPDMLGNLKIQKFAEGGVVTGGVAGKDSVPAFLQPGEVVMPVKLVEFWKKTSDKATKGISLLSSKFKGFYEHLRGSNKEGPKLDKNLGRMRDNMGRFVSKKNVKGLKDIEESLEGIGDNVEALTMFATLAAAGEGIKDLGSNVSGAFSEMEGGESTTFVEAMNDMNQSLGLSREGLGNLKKAAVDSADAGGAGLNEMGMAMAALAEAGVTSEEVMLGLGASIANMATATTADVGQLSALSYRLADGFDFSSETITKMFNATRVIAQSTAADAGDLMAQMEGQAKSMSTLMSSVSEETGAAILTNMAAVTGSLSENWGAAGSEISDSMARALGGNVEDIRMFQSQFGMSIEDVRKKMASGDLTGMFDNLAGKINQMSPHGLEQLKEAMGFEGSIDEFMAIGTNIDGINSNLDRLGTSNKTLLDAADASEQLATGANNNRTMFDKMAKSFTMAVSQAELFGVSGGEVLDMMKEMNPVSVLAIANLVKMAVVGFGGLLKAVPGVGGAFGKLGGKLSGFFGKGGPTEAIPSGPGAGKGVKGFMQGFSSGLKALGKGLMSFGTAMIGPGGLGLAALVIALVAIGFAIKLAAPLFEMLGKVIAKMIDGFVEMFKTIATLDAKQMIMIGPALIIAAYGVGVFAVSVGLLGIAMGAAAVGVGLFRLATGGKGLAGGGLASVLHDLIGGFKPLAKESKGLTAVNRVMKQLVTFMVSFAKLALIIGGLSVGAAIASAVDSVLGFFGVDSPMESLAKQGRQMVGTLISLVSDFSAVSGLAAGMNGIVVGMQSMLGFIKQYASLADTISELPSQGVFSSISDSISGFFGGSSPLEKLADDAGPMLETLSKLTSQFSALQYTAGAAAGAFSGVQADGMSQPGAGAAMGNKQLQTVVQAVLARADESPLHTDLLENNRLLRIIAGNGGSSPIDVASPTRAHLMQKAPPPSQFAMQLAQGNY